MAGAYVILIGMAGAYVIPSGMTRGYVSTVGMTEGVRHPGRTTQPSHPSRPVRPPPPSSRRDSPYPPPPPSPPERPISRHPGRSGSPLLPSSRPERVTSFPVIPIGADRPISRHPDRSGASSPSVIPTGAPSQGAQRRDLTAGNALSRSQYGERDGKALRSASPGPDGSRHRMCHLWASAPLRLCGSALLFSSRSPRPLREIVSLPPAQESLLLSPRDSQRELCRSRIPSLSLAGRQITTALLRRTGSAERPPALPWRHG